MAEQRVEVAAIVGSEESPTFENTVVALERSGRLLSRAGLVFGNLASSVSTPRLREIERELAPLEAAHADAIRLDPALFAGHSLRSGFLTEAARQPGANIFKMREVSRHKSLDILAAYVREHDGFRDHAGERFL